jgi:thiamine phosphate synthase YjbQ (UPF0047 family)
MDVDTPVHGHCHCRHALLGASTALLVDDHDLVLGWWQRLLLVALDHPRPREMVVQVTGVAPTGMPS